MVDVAASPDGYVVGEELQGDYFEDGEQEFGGGWDFDYMLYELADVFGGVLRRLGLAFACGSGGVQLLLNFQESSQRSVYGLRIRE